MREFVLTQGKATFVDDEDVVVMSQYVWYAAYRPRDRRWVVQACSAGRTLYLHRVLVGASDEQVVDHRDGNPLNNQRSNLRIATPLGNSRNARRAARNGSGFKGVSQDKSLWRARITICGKTVSLGHFPSADIAAVAYDEAARAAFGEFACVNFAQAGERCALTVAP